MNNKVYQKLLSTLKFKIDNNFSYFIVKENFKTNNYFLYVGGMLLPTHINGKDKNDNIILSILYKIKNEKYFKNMDDAGEGLIKLTYENLASLLISKRIEAFYVDGNKEDTEIKDILNEL